MLLPPLAAREIIAPLRPPPPSLRPLLPLLLLLLWIVLRTGRCAAPRDALRRRLCLCVVAVPGSRFGAAFLTIGPRATVGFFFFLAPPLPAVAPRSPRVVPEGKTSSSSSMAAAAGGDDDDNDNDDDYQTAHLTSTSHQQLIFERKSTSLRKAFFLKTRLTAKTTSMAPLSLFFDSSCGILLISFSTFDSSPATLRSCCSQVPLAAVRDQRLRVHQYLNTNKESTLRHFSTINWR